MSYLERFRTPGKPAPRARAHEITLGVRSDQELTNAAVRFVVVEAHANTLDSDLLASEPIVTSFLRQAEGELSSDLTERVTERIATLERSGRSIGSAVIALAPYVDDDPKGARHVLACLLLSRDGRRRGPNELVLTVDGNAGISVRHSVMDLVEALVSESGAAFVPIRAQFRAERASCHSASGNSVPGCRTSRQ